jgi:8-oxo-dGTP diphosphatase
MTAIGDGWTYCRAGHRHWGRYGAAGLLAYTADGCVLLHKRAPWSHHGGTWSSPGGALSHGESVVSGALREASEECGLRAELVSVTGTVRDDHGGWSYETVVASAPYALAVNAASGETSEVAWIAIDDVQSLRLHPGFAGIWPELRQRISSHNQTT